MSTHDYVIENATGANFRSDLNLNLQAILSNNSSSTAPSTTTAGMLWADTTTNLLKVRDSSNTAWYSVGSLSSGSGGNSLFSDSIGTTVQAYDADLVTVATNGVGTGNNQIVQLSASGELPAVDGSNLTGITTGKVLQIIDFEDSTNISITGDLTNDDTIPQNSEGGELISSSFTPISATSHLYVELSSSTYRATNQDILINLFTGASTSAFASAKLYATGAQIASHIVMGDIASISTSTVTFSARLCSGTTSYTNGDSGSRKFGGALKTRLRIIEVAA